MVREHLWGLCDEMCENACVWLCDEMCENACVWGLCDEMCESACVGFCDEMCENACVWFCDRMCGFWSREKKPRFKP